MTEYALGIDIGGTFTDIVLLHLQTGRLSTSKVLTTYDDPARGAIEGVRLAIADACEPAQIVRVVHATTLFTNALIERRGARAGLLTTRGFADTLEISRERKYDIYDLFLSVPQPLIERDLRREIDGRILADGTEVTALDVEALRREVAHLVAHEGIEALAIAFMNAHAYPQHEIQAAALIAEWHPDLPLSLSHQVSPEIGEYERMSTTAANAYVQPLATGYIERLVERLSGLGVDAPFLMMLSSGGLADISEALRFPVRLLESGPAAGVLSAASFGRMVGETSLIAFDMGGTTAKVALVENAEPQRANRFEAAPEKRFAPGSGLPINISTIELIEIGAGGGSIARVDSLGLLKVGPKSASSTPGPACYGFGGQDLTVTDSDMLLGCLNPDYFSGGTVKVNLQAARDAAQNLADGLNLSADATAMGVYDIVCENMAGAARVHVARHGKDLRDFSLYATGGAGPVHAVNVARKLGIDRVIIPVAAGVASALGLLLAPARIDRMAPIGAFLSTVDVAALDQRYSAIIAEAKSVVTRTAGDTKLTVGRSVDLRYARQGFDITVPVPDEPVTAEALLRWKEAYESEYARQFGMRLEGQGIEISNIRGWVVAPTFEGKIQIGDLPANAMTGATSRSLHPRLSGQDEPVPVIRRAALGRSAQTQAPVLIEEQDSTIVVGGLGSVRTDALGNIIIELDRAVRSLAAE